MSNLIDKHPKVFISYSWANENTVNFTSDLAERLVQHGVDVMRRIFPKTIFNGGRIID